MSLDDPVTSSNYLEVAQADERAAAATQQDGSSYISSLDDKAIDQSSKSDKATAREQRIAAAVQRSRTEYKEEHAYTERAWYRHRESHRGPVGKRGIDSQHLEAVATSMYYSNPPDYQAVVQLVMAAFDPTDSSFGGISKELVDIGIRAAIACADAPVAITLAQSTRGSWKGQFAGIAATAADAYMFNGQSRAALLPLLISGSSFGLHYPIVHRLIKALDQSGLSESSAAKPLRAQLARVETLRKPYFESPLFASTIQKPDFHTACAPAAVTLDISAAAQELDLDDEGRQALQGTWQRSIKGINLAEVDEGRTVRSL